MTFRLAETEAQFQKRVEEYATLRQWDWMHIARLEDARGYWRTSVRGTMGAGWPDLIMVKGHRMLAVELKVATPVTPKQERVLGVLTALGYVEVYVWRPEDWDWLTEVLDR